MPHKPLDKLSLAVPAWVDAIEGRCLRETLVEALVARHAAVREGALQHAQARKVLEAGDETMSQIEYQRVAGRLACRKAATAIRKYTEAAVLAEGTNPPRPKTHRHAQ